MMVLRVLFGCFLAFLTATNLAQGVYVTKGKNGPVFSNVPQPGAKEIDLKPINVIAPVLPAPSVPSGAVSPAVADGPVERKSESMATATYRSFFVVYPENDGAVAANTATFDVHLAVDPPLQLDQRHAFAVSLNGRPVGQRYTSTEFTIPPEFWSDRLPPDNQTIQLDASIVDGEGRVLKQAEPVRFVMRQLTIRSHRQGPEPRWPNDRHRDTGAPVVAPTPKPAPEKPMQAVMPSINR